MSPRLIQALALGLSAGLLSGVWRLTPTINRGREALNTMAPEAAVEQAPPEYAFAVQAFGAFRGLLTNIAFIRAETYKEQGRFYDAMQLANWICKLQPRFPSVWEFQAWNMAWNISVKTYTPEERWNWVYNGVKLLRDEGLRFNPRAVNLYKQLAWIFVNKMSEPIDDFHLFYKRNWAWRMHLVLGPPPDPLGLYRPDQPFEKLPGQIGDDPLAEAARIEERRRREREREEELKKPEWQRDPRKLEIPEEPQRPGDATQTATDGTPGGAAQAPETSAPTAYDIVKKAAYDRLQAIADAPRTLEELYRQTPETRAMVQQLRELGILISDDPLTEDEYWSPRGLAFRFFAPCRALLDPMPLMTAITTRPAADPDRALRERLDAIIGLRAGNPAGQALLRFLQRKVLREVYKLDPARMAELVQYFGPMDWRSVDAHSLYWVNEALIQGKESLRSIRNDKTNTARLIFFSLRNLFLRNRMTFEVYHGEVNKAYLNMTPDLNFVEPMHQAYITYGPMLDPEPGPGAGETYKVGHINFLTEAIRLLYFAGRTREASHYYEYLRTTYPRNDDGTINQRYLKPLRDFVMDSFYESGVDVSTKEAQQTVSILLLSAFNELAQGNYAQYQALVTKAHQLHGDFNRTKQAERLPNRALNPFSEIHEDVLTDWLLRPAPGTGPVVTKARLWRNLPTYLRQAVYDRVIASLQRECAEFGFDAARAFPEPPGMEEYRQQRPPRTRPYPERQVETVPRPDN